MKVPVGHGPLPHIHHVGSEEGIACDMLSSQIDGTVGLGSSSSIYACSEESARAVLSPPDGMVSLRILVSISSESVTFTPWSSEPDEHLHLQHH